MKLETKKRNLFVVPSIVVLILLLAYPLSVGPVLVICDWGLHYGILPEESIPMLETVYTPIIWMTLQYNWFAEFIVWYLGLWAPLYIE